MLEDANENDGFSSHNQIPKMPKRSRTKCINRAINEAQFSMLSETDNL